MLQNFIKKSKKERILNHIIESGLQRKIDFIDLFLNIHNHLAQLKDSEDLSKCSKHWKKKQAEGKDWLSQKKTNRKVKEKSSGNIQKI